LIEATYYNFTGMTDFVPRRSTRGARARSGLSWPSDLRDKTWAGPVTVDYPDGTAREFPAYTEDELAAVVKGAA
jgi:hypothetical protein